MAVPTYSLISVDELKDHITAGGPEKAAQLEFSCTAASASIESRVNQKLTDRGAEFTEYHSIQDWLETIYTGRSWISSVTTLHEDETWPRAYGAGSLLVAGTDFEIVEGNRIRRISPSGRMLWKIGNRVVKLVYRAGFRGIDNLPLTAEVLPADLKQAALFVAAAIFKESDRQRWGVSAVTDATGNYTRFLGYFTPQIDEMLAPYRRSTEFHRTWEAA